MAAEIYRRYDDGYVTRRMRPEDAEVVIGWFSSTMVSHFPRDDIRLCLRLLSPEQCGFYAGEVDGKMVASWIQLHWGDGHHYGSGYYVEETHRRKGYGSRLREQVARDHLGSRYLTIDAVEDSVPSNRKYGYTEAFTVSRWQGAVTEESLVPGPEQYGVSIVEAQEIPLDVLTVYDDKHFISPGSAIRRDFLKEWIHIPGGKSLVAMDTEKRVIGYGCRRPCFPSGGHMVGPLYADSADVALTLLKALCRDIVGEMAIIIIWNPNHEALKLVEHFSMKKSFDCQRMHLNGDPHEFKTTVFGLTSLIVCGF